jgi:NAD(P)-dependent dehydrogenase (short-subunit alcohol dehydrogenase family)
MTASIENPDVPPSEWGAAAATAFTETSHHTPNATIDPTKARLPTPFVVCIVGASRGIGAGVAFSYAKAGASGLVLASRRLSGLEETAKQCKALQPGVKTEVVACDITSAESVANLAEKTKAAFGRLDVVVVNSGFSGPVVLKVENDDPATVQNAINVNYMGTYHCAKHLIPILLETTNGAKAFVAVNSFAALLIRGAIANTQYCVSKMAQLRLMEYVHEQYSRQGLRSFSVHPGAVASEMADGAPEFFRSFLIDSPELCGAFCVWLTKDGGKRDWLSGRLLSANWDADELEARKDEVVEKDLLKFRLLV